MYLGKGMVIGERNGYCGKEWLMVLRGRMSRAEKD